MSTSVSRHFATLGHTQVHYRRAGSGPAVLLLHQSPASSAEFEPLIARLASRFTAIAPDMPGYGASDACVGVSLSIEFLADRVAALMDELGVATAAVYGLHTGASVALSLARRYPRRLTLAICEGLLCLGESQRQQFLSRYIPPFTPRGDGAHLAWLWTRIKDQSLFFPWYEHKAEARLDLDATPVAALAARAEDWLRSGEGYAAGYAAAFNYDPRADMPWVEVPLLVQCHRHDPLAAHLPRLSPLPAQAEVRCFTTAAQGLEGVFGALLRHAGDGPAAPTAASTRPMAGQVWQDYVVSHGRSLRVLRKESGTGRAIVVQHAAQSSAGACRDWLAEFGNRGPALAIEMPGHGETDGDGCELEHPDCAADLICGALDALGVGDCDLVGCGAGASLQVEVALRQPARAHSLTLVGAVDLSRDPALQATLSLSYTAPSPDSHGGYLLRAWHQVRDHLLFFPWYERRREFALGAAPCLEPGLLQSLTRDVLLAREAGVALRRGEIGYPLLERLARLRIAARHAAAVWDPRHAHSRALAGVASQFTTLSQDTARCSRELIAFINLEPP